MNQIFTMLWQTGLWIFSDSRRMMMLHQLIRAGQQYYNSLTPTQKAKVDAIILWGVDRAVKFALKDVLGDVAHQVVGAGCGEKVAELAQATVARGVEIGYDKAMAELRKS